MSSVGPVQLRMATGVYSGDCHFFLVGSTHRELVVAGPAATRGRRARGRGGERGGARQRRNGRRARAGLARRRARRRCARPRRPQAPSSGPAVDTDAADDDLEQFVPEPLRAASRARGRRGRAPHRHGRVPEVLRRRRAARGGGRGGGLPGAGAARPVGRATLRPSSASRGSSPTSTSTAASSTSSRARRRARARTRSGCCGRSRRSSTRRRG